MVGGEEEENWIDASLDLMRIYYGFGVSGDIQKGEARQG
jgi:hypothetical protein